MTLVATTGLEQGVGGHALRARDLGHPAWLATTLGTGSVNAQGAPVGTPGDPRCHGQRVSAGNHRVEDIVVPELGIGLQDFRLTPKGRVELLNAFHVDGRTDWTVQDFQRRVRASCEAPRP
jgi:hypothetical protein